jgi:hypothetical protein
MSTEQLCLSLSFFCNRRPGGNPTYSVGFLLELKRHQHIVPQIFEKGNGLKFIKPVEFEKSSFKFIHVRECPLSPLPRISLDSRRKKSATIAFSLTTRGVLVRCHHLVWTNAADIRKEEKKSVGNVANEAENVLKEITDRIHFLISFSFTTIIIAH